MRWCWLCTRRQGEFSRVWCCVSVFVALADPARGLCRGMRSKGAWQGELAELLIPWPASSLRGSTMLAARGNKTFAIESCKSGLGQMLYDLQRRNTAGTQLGVGRGSSPPYHGHHPHKPTFPCPTPLPQHQEPPGEGEVAGHPLVCAELSRSVGRLPPAFRGWPPFGGERQQGRATATLGREVQARVARSLCSH